MIRQPTLMEETIIKRSFNNWRIFEIYNNLNILITSSELSHSTPFKKNYYGNLKCYNNKNKIDNTKLTDEKYIEDTGIRNVYICSPKSHLVINLKIKPTILGLRIGSLSGKKFIPNLNFAEIVLGNNAKLDFPHIIVREKAANLIIYGRDVIGDSIISYYKKIKENEILIIINEHLEVIGIGRARYNGDLIAQKEKITVENIQDIGTTYLKDENKYRNRQSIP